MIIPVRCMSCGKPLGGLWEKYNKLIEAGETPAKAMEALGIERYCCRTLFLTHKDILSKVAKYRI